MTRWMMRIFFSCTVAFAIPYESLFKLEAFGYGSIMGIVACIATKVVSGACMGDARFVIGWAMVGRAEFAYLIAEMAKSGGILSNEMFSIVIWALLYATIVAPIAFKYVLGRHVVKLAEREGGDVESAKATVKRMKRAMTLNTANLPDRVLEEERDDDENKIKVLQAELARKEQEIVALKGHVASCKITDSQCFW